MAGGIAFDFRWHLLCATTQMRLFTNTHCWCKCDQDAHLLSPFRGSRWKIWQLSFPLCHCTPFKLVWLTRATVHNVVAIVIIVNFELWSTWTMESHIRDSQMPLKTLIFDGSLCPFRPTQISPIGCPIIWHSCPRAWYLSCTYVWDIRLHTIGHCI